MTRRPRGQRNRGATWPSENADAAQQADLTIVALDHDGNGYGYLSVAPDASPGPAAEGASPPPLRAVVPFTIPGEQVRVRIWRRGAGQPGSDEAAYAAADLLEVLVPVPDRAVPPCPLFGRCGGCQLQHLPYQAQLEWKTAVIRARAAPLGLSDQVAPCIGSPRSYGYRSKITPHHDRPRPGEPVAIGFLRIGRKHQVVDVERCPLATDGINQRLPSLRAEIAASAPTGRLGASFLIREAASGVTTDPDSRVTERVGDLELEFVAREFFQNNPFLLPRLVEYVVDAAAAGATPLLVDAYAGSGLFTLAAAPRFASAIGVEVSPGAVRAARENATRNDIANVRFVAADASRIFAEIDAPGSGAAVIVDPPRKGCGDAFLAQLLAFAPARIVYVSCNPETLMRDAAVLLGGGYAVRALQPFDMFPQTRHVECVAVFARA